MSVSFQPELDQAGGRRGRLRRLAAALVLLAAGAGVWLWQGGEAENEAAAPAPRKAGVRVEERGATMPVSAAPSSLPAQAPAAEVAGVEKLSQWPVRPGVEGQLACPEHCAHCLGEQKLAACREEYAELMYAQVVGERVVDELLSGKIREACRRMAGEALVDWSFSERRPLLVPDPQLNLLESRYLGEYRAMLGPES